MFLSDHHFIKHYVSYLCLSSSYVIELKHLSAHLVHWQRLQKAAAHRGEERTAQRWEWPAGVRAVQHPHKDKMTSQTSTCHLWIQHCHATFSVEARGTDLTLAQLSQITWIIQLGKTIRQFFFSHLEKLEGTGFVPVQRQQRWWNDGQNPTFSCKCSLVVKWCLSYITYTQPCLVEFAAHHSERERGRTQLSSAQTAGRFQGAPHGSLWQILATRSFGFYWGQNNWLSYCRIEMHISPVQLSAEAVSNVKAGKLI